MGEGMYRTPKRSLKEQIVRWFTQWSLRRVFITVVILICAVWIAERLINAGSFFGYQVLQKDGNSKVAESKQAESFACMKLTSDEVGSVFETEVKRIGGLFPDKKEPNLVSTCSYQIGSDNPRSVSILVRDVASAQTAQGIFNDLKGRNKFEELPEIGPDTIFTAASRQLNSKDGKRIVSITVSDKNSTSSVDNKKAVIELFKKYK